MKEKHRVVMSPLELFSLVSFVSLFLVGFAINAADHLSENYFPPDSPVLAGYYPNDFLPWCVLLFVYLGAVTTDLIARRTNHQPYPIVAAIAVLVVYILISIAGSMFNNIRLENLQHVSWAYYIGQLIYVCGHSWFIGGLVCLYYYRVVHKSSKENQPNNV